MAMKTNLITRNVILRFKEGLGILKLEDKVGKYFRTLGKWYDEHGNPIKLPVIENGVTLYPDGTTKRTIVKYVSSPQIQKRYKGRDGKWYEAYKKGNDWLYRQSGTDDKFQIMSKNYYTPEGYSFYLGKNVLKKEKTNPTTPPNTPPDTSKRDSNRYISTLGDIEAYKNSLIAEGLTDRDAVKAFLEKLGVVADGIWGKNTEAAYQAMLAKNKEPIPTLTLSVLLYVPSLGYRTNFDYTGSNSNIRDLGFNDYTTMVNFINNNPDNLFSRDMVQRFGNTNDWNLNNVESALNVSGKYRPGRGGDFSDIMKSQADWAGTQNGIYDRNLNFWNNLKVINGRLLFKQGGLISKNPVKRFKTKVK